MASDTVNDVVAPTSPSAHSVPSAGLAGPASSLSPALLPNPAAPRRSGAQAVAALTMAGVGVGVLSLLGGEDGPVLCIFRRCTGGYCPGCGGTRALSSFVRGDLGAAWTGHPMVVLLAVQLLVGLVLVAAGAGRIVSRFRDRVFYANLVVAVVVWGVRLQTGAIPSPGLPTLGL